MPVIKFLYCLLIKQFLLNDLIVDTHGWDQTTKQNVWTNGDKILPFDLIDISQAMTSTLHYDFTIETLNEAIKQLDLLLVLILKRFCSANTDLTCSAVKLKSYELIKTSGS